MTDRGFTIAHDLKALNVELNILAFLFGRYQLTKVEVKESQLIASVPIHVERAVRQIKTFKPIRFEIPFAFHVSINLLYGQ